MIDNNIPLAIFYKPERSDSVDKQIYLQFNNDTVTISYNPIENNDEEYFILQSKYNTLLNPFDTYISQIKKQEDTQESIKNLLTILKYNFLLVNTIKYEFGHPRLLVEGLSFRENIFIPDKNDRLLVSKSPYHQPNIVETGLIDHAFISKIDNPSELRLDAIRRVFRLPARNLDPPLVISMPEMRSYKEERIEYLLSDEYQKILQQEEAQRTLQATRQTQAQAEAEKATKNFRQFKTTSKDIGRSII